MMVKNTNWNNKQVWNFKITTYYIEEEAGDRSNGRKMDFIPNRKTDIMKLMWSWLGNIVKI